LRYTVLIHQTEEGGFWAEVPALPGCFSQGETLEETVVNVRQAIESHLQALRQDNQQFPAEDSVVGTVKVAV
jgi:predicted RNase H-like HicB family nuclease